MVVLTRMGPWVAATQKKQHLLPRPECCDDERGQLRVGLWRGVVFDLMLVAKAE